jgi:hypothetical protein
MSSSRRRQFVAAATATLGLYACQGLRASGADEDKEKPEKKANEQILLSAADVLDKKVLGQATVEFLVDEVRTLDIDSVFKPGTSHAQIVKAKTGGEKRDQEFLMIVSKESATALLKSGIVDVPGYFSGKQIRVSGIIERIDRPPGETTVYKIHVRRLDQLENVRRP